MISSSLIYGNWKMHKTPKQTQTFLRELMDLVDTTTDGVAVFPPFTALAAANGAVQGTRIAVGAQTVSQYDTGAYTGEISAAMLLDLGIQMTLIGHSERRHIFKESHPEAIDKLKCAQKHGLRAVFCVGETESERHQGRTEAVILEQIKGLDSIDNLVIAYEPVWAIGTGHVATPEQAEEVHDFIRRQLLTVFGPTGAQVPLIYGGSVKQDNIKKLIAQRDIDGVLVGGASLTVQSFSSIINQVRGK